MSVPAGRLLSTMNIWIKQIAGLLGIGLLLGSCSLTGQANEYPTLNTPEPANKQKEEVSNKRVNKGPATVATELKDFKAIKLGGDTQTACSPAQSQDDGFIGVAINAPSEVTFTLNDDNANARLHYFPLCGYYQLNMAELIKDATINLYVLNVETEHVNKGAIIEQDAGTEAPLPFDVPPLSAEDVEDQLSAAFFNLNVADYVSIPAVEAEYKVLAKVGNTRSNAMDVSVELAQKDDL